MSESTVETRTPLQIVEDMFLQATIPDILEWMAKFDENFRTMNMKERQGVMSGMLLCEGLVQRFDTNRIVSKRFEVLMNIHQELLKSGK